MSAEPDPTGQLLRTAEQTLAFLKQFTGPERRTLPLYLLEALAAETAKLARAGVSTEKIRFDAKELAEHVANHTEGKVPRGMDSARTRSWVTRRWQPLTELLEGLDGSLSEHAKAIGSHIVPTLNREESRGGRGNPTYYYLSSRPLPADADPYQFALPKGAIRYALERRLRRNHSIIGWLLVNRCITRTALRWMQVGIGAAFSAFVLLVVLYLVKLPNLSFTSARVLEMLLLTLVFAAFYETGWPILTLSKRQIIPAPAWAEGMLDSEPHYVQVFSVTGDERKPPMTEWRLVRYAAVCPVCGGRVVVVNGRGELSGRLVGSCRNSPREHVWSFDHVTRVGLPLRQTGELVSAGERHKTKRLG